MKSILRKWGVSYALHGVFDDQVSARRFAQDLRGQGYRCVTEKRRPGHVVYSHPRMDMITRRAAL